MKIKLDKYHVGWCYTLAPKRSLLGKNVNIPKKIIEKWNKIDEEFEQMQLEMEKYYNEI